MKARKKKEFDPLVYTRRTVFMQRCSDWVQRGYHRYVSGQVSVEKAPALADKFRRLYDANLKPIDSYRQRQLGYASARLLLLSEKCAPGMVTWALLVGEGKLPIETNEIWRNPLEHDERMAFWGYELVRLTKPEEPKPVWTWRYQKNRLEEVRHQIVHAIRGRRDQELERLMDGVWHSPGFSGIRTQVKAIGNLIASEWKRAGRPQDAMPKIPMIWYLRRLKDQGRPLSSMVRSYVKEKSGKKAEPATARDWAKEYEEHRAFMAQALKELAALNAEARQRQNSRSRSGQ